MMMTRWWWWWWWRWWWWHDDTADHHIVMVMIIMGGEGSGRWHIVIKFHYHPHSGTQRNWGLKLQVRVTDDRGALQRNKQGSLTTQNLQCFNLFFQKQPGLAPLYVFHNFFFVETKISCEQFHFLHLRKCADTCNAIIQGDMFQTSRELQMLSGSSSLLMALLRLIDFFWPIVIILTRVHKSQNQDSRVTCIDDHDFVFCRWWRFGFESVHGAGRGPEGVVGMGEPHNPKPTFSIGPWWCHDMV